PPPGLHGLSPRRRGEGPDRNDVGGGGRRRRLLRAALRTAGPAQDLRRGARGVGHLRARAQELVVHAGELAPSRSRIASAPPVPTARLRSPRSIASSSEPTSP